VNCIAHLLQDNSVTHHQNQLQYQIQIIKQIYHKDMTYQLSVLLSIDQPEIQEKQNGEYT